MNTIAHLPPDRCPPMIDLTRHLPDLRASLRPGRAAAPPAAAPDTENGDEFTDGAKIIFALFLVFFLLCLAGYHLACDQ